MTKKDLIINLEVELEMKKDDLKRSKERWDRYTNQKNVFGTGFEYGIISQLEKDIDSLERLLKEAK